MDRETGGLAAQGGWSQKLRRDYRASASGNFDGELTPNVRLEMPSDVKRYNAMLPTQAMSIYRSRIPTSAYLEKVHWNFVEYTLPLDQLEL